MILHAGGVRRLRVVSKVVTDKQQQTNRFSRYRIAIVYNIFPKKYRDIKTENR